MFNVVWIIQPLRAFRRAEIIFEAVLFESCLGEAAGSLAVVSNFFFRVLVPSGVVLGVFLEHLEPQGRRLGSLGAHLGILWVPFLGSLGLLGGPLGPPGSLCRSQGGSLGGPGRPCGLLGRYGGGLRENAGNSKTHFKLILVSFFMIFRYSFG